MTQGLEIFFKYTGQPITCYRCGSTEHVVKNCPKQRPRFNHIRVEDRVLSAPPNPPNSQDMQETQMETTCAEDSDDEISESVSSEMLSSAPDLYCGASSRDLFAEPIEGSRKQPPPSPLKSRNLKAKKAAAAVENPDKNQPQSQ